MSKQPGNKQFSPEYLAQLQGSQSSRRPAVPSFRVQPIPLSSYRQPATSTITSSSSRQPAPTPSYRQPAPSSYGQQSAQSSSQMADCPKPLGSVSYKRDTDLRKQRFSFVSNGVTYRLKIQRQTLDLCGLLFHDQNGNVQPFPPEFTVTDSDGQPALYLGGQFVLVWLNSYRVSFQGTPVLQITNQRQQSIFGSVNVVKGHGEDTTMPAVPIVPADDAVID